MTTRLRFVLVALLLTSCIGAHSVQADDKGAGDGPKLRLIVPAYFYPAGEGLRHWDRLIETADHASIVAIVNPASGPGKRSDDNYVAVLKRVSATKMTRLGYVTTSYCKRPIADVKADVDQWLRLYPSIQGIFFDEQASGAESASYQADLYSYVRATKPLRLVVSNPGTVCAEEFFTRPAADVFCLFEGPKAFEASLLPDWARKHARDHVLVLAYNVPTRDAMRACIEAATRSTVGYIYVTDRTGANPWDGLPSYWDEELRVINRAQSPP